MSDKAPPRSLLIPEFERVPGVYFLCNSGDVVYVGQSRDVIQRLRIHRSGRDRPTRGVHFDRALYLPYPENELNFWETIWICVYKPKANLCQSNLIEPVLNTPLADIALGRADALQELLKDIGPNGDHRGAVGKMRGEKRFKRKLPC